ncbi:MAG TPA: thioredoxin domain-containing protein [Tepidisphaeraceae bacterium]|jgi:hypothetical protein
MPHTNRLAKETSPYLLQHAHNPVDWYPWGPEAFAAARAQNKPIFLSVGYSTCYWCHVMERQSFENEAIAKEMNDRFINIKVDREERPDVDQLYMTAVQVLTRQGGWPMSVFLLPDLRPFYGGTYFPPTDAYGRPGFPTLLRALDDAYHNRKDEVHRSADQIVDILRQLARPLGPSQPITIDQGFIEELIERSVSDYESVHGGFGAAPKFPRETLLELLLVYTQSQIAHPKSQIPQMLRHTLDAMANGGIRDHLGGAFHRYSTDAKWLVPHFEIMLYDNAMLGWVYVEASKQFNEPRYAGVARRIFDFILREMTSPDGAFYTAIDAEVDAMEGGSYLWTSEEIQGLLKKGDASLFEKVYGVDKGPNFADPHHGSGTPDKNILYLPDGPAQEDDPRIVAAREKLCEARRQRKQPLLDTKIITSWNALMIRALAHGGAVLGEPRYTEAAERAAMFLMKNHVEQHGTLIRTSRDGVAKHEGYLDDYAFLVQAMLALDEAKPQEGWRERAAELAEQMNERFGDARHGGFYFTARDAQDLIVRQKTAGDSPLPSGNAIAAMSLLQLGAADGAKQTIAAFAEQLNRQGEGMSAMVQAALLYVTSQGPFTVEARQQPLSERPMSPEELAQRVVGIGTSWRSPTELEVKLQILRPYHVNSHSPGEGLIATELRVESSEAIEYPAGEVYGDQTKIVVRFKAPVTGNLHASLRYQACDESSCLSEVMRSFEIAPPSSTGRGQG